MLTQTIGAVQLAGDVAALAATALSPDAGLAAGEAQSVPVEISLDFAVLCSLSGEVGGELALFVDDEIGRTLTAADGAEVDLATALTPLLQQIAGTLGGVTLGTPATVDSRIAQQRVNGRSEMAVVGLDDGVAVRAAVAVGLDGAPPVVAAAVASPVLQNERLDLLRHVEMAATVELGRAKMTINDLLGLRDGAIIELDRAAGEAADLFVNGRLIARGEIVVVDENYALRVTQIVSDEPGR